ncbi:MAG: hypothetical protein D6736_12970 [Nitrospinota bacterium]|nr:MAG: hypothetical protein D6736_12970 [Nitrospinota bacterium]
MQRSCIWIWITGLVMLFTLMTACGKSKEQKVAPKASKAESKTPAQPGTLSGTITVAPALKDKLPAKPLLFIEVRKRKSLKTPPLIAKRIFNPSFPYKYSLTEDDITLVGSESSFNGEVYVTARIDPTGTVGPPKPGDLGGEFPGNPATVGDTNVDIVIDTAY